MADKPITVDDVRKALREGLKPDVPAQVASSGAPVVTVDDVRRFLKGNPPDVREPQTSASSVESSNDELATETEPVKEPEKAPPVTKTAPKAKPTHTGKKAR